MELNASFFEGDVYREQVEELECFRHIGTAISREVEGVDRLLDLGNGGVFAYETECAREVVAVDLFLEDLPASRFPANVTPRNGDALALEEEPESYDAVLIGFLFHHLVGSRPDDLMANIRRVLADAERLLRPGGRLIVPESCVPAWFYRVERALFRPLTAITKTGLMSHPATLQVTYPMLLELVAERFESPRGYPIPTGRWLSQFGHRWPAALTPARPYMVTASRASGA